MPLAPSWSRNNKISALLIPLWTIKLHYHPRFARSDNDFIFMSFGQKLDFRDSVLTYERTYESETLEMSHRVKFETWSMTGVVVDKK